jgi:Zn-dependent peptidase ImmA (M78 family)/transcriptional regulator with XRE-family HTH domain
VRGIEELLFHPERLTLARQRRAMNKSQCARAARITPQTLSTYENGHAEPSPSTVARLAEALDFPISFFYADMSDPLAVGGASFRALSRMTASQRDAALAAGTMCVMLNGWIDSNFDLPQPDLPDLKPSLVDPEGAAAYVRSGWGLGDQPIRNVLHLLESRGVRVFALAYECREVDAFSFWRDDTPFICVATHKTPERAVFDLSHELGHLVLHRGHGSPRGRDEEREADAFASAFLMPRADVLAHVPRSPDLQDLIRCKSRWKVATAALNYRIHQLGLTSDWHYREICIELSRLGRTREANSLPREQSQVLHKVLAALRADGISRRDIADDLDLNPSDIDALMSGLVVLPVAGGMDDDSETYTPRPNLRLI